MASYFNLAGNAALNHIKTVSGPDVIFDNSVKVDAVSSATGSNPVQFTTGVKSNTLDVVSGTVLTIAKDVDMSGKTIGNLVNPVSAQQAATKNYVDTFSFPPTPLIGGAILTAGGQNQPSNILAYQDFASGLLGASPVVDVLRYADTATTRLRFNNDYSNVGIVAGKVKYFLNDTSASVKFDFTIDSGFFLYGIDFFTQTTYSDAGFNWNQFEIPAKTGFQFAFISNVFYILERSAITVPAAASL